MTDREPIADLYVCWNCADHAIEVDVGAEPPEYHDVCGHGPLQWSGQLFDRETWARVYEERSTRVEQSPIGQRSNSMTSRERVNLDLLDDNPFQPRQEIDPKTLQLLAESIKGVGLLQAPVGRRMQDGRVQIAYGHRRVAACKLLRDQGEWGPAIDMDVADVGETSDAKMAVMAISENVARQRLTQMEVVRAHRRAVDETDLSIQGLADELGVSRSALSNNLRVLELPDFVLEHVESGAMRVSVAREFLVLQNAHHAHLSNMREVVNQILLDERQGRPVNWSRKNVRKRISENISYSEKEFRPIGPQTANSTAGGNRVATFDTDAFSTEFPDCLHTIPADDGRSENYRMLENFDKSRVWTCEVKEWSRRQSRATREANQAAEVSGTKPGSHSGARDTRRAAPPNRDKQFESALAADPVFKTIVASRAKKGPNRPVTDEERAALGTRAELRDVDYNTKFWKLLSKGDPSRIGDWHRQGGGHVPPYFPLEECGNCTAGAAYAKSRSSYTLDKVTLVCMNQKCYQDKCGAGGSRYREELEAHKLDVHRLDAQMARQVTQEMETLSTEALRTLATVLVSAQTKLDWQHPFGEPFKKWSWETGAVARVCDLLRAEKPAFEQWGRHPYGHAEIDADSLQDVADGDLRDLVANLVVHHLRQSGRLESVSRETAASPPNPLEVRQILTGEPATAEVGKD